MSQLPPDKRPKPGQRPAGTISSADDPTVVANLNPGGASKPPGTGGIPEQHLTKAPRSGAMPGTEGKGEPTMATNFNVEGGPPSPATLSQGSHQDQLWGDYQIGALLGRGGMGSVYAGKQVSLDRAVAIKVLPKNLSDNPSFKARFMLEAKAVAQISSPYVIQVYSAGSQEGHHYFAMEYVEGVDLARKLRDGFRPSYREALTLVTQAARGLAAAGEHGIVHRDIKPGNMMVTSKGHLKLMDFGLVRLARSEDTGLTMAGTIMGTVSYFSPEQGRGERCDSRTDIYALGVVFYELLTGKLPFTGGDVTSVIYQHIHASPKPPKEIDPNIPDDYQAVVLKCMQKVPDHRYQQASELVADLEALANGLPPATAFIDPEGLRQGGTIVRSRAFKQERGRSRLILAMVGIVVVAGAGVGWWVKNKEAPALNQHSDVAGSGTTQTGTGTLAHKDPETSDPNSTTITPGAPPVVPITPADGPHDTTQPTVSGDPSSDAQLASAKQLLLSGDLGGCRKLVTPALQAHPDLAPWVELGHQLDRTEGLAHQSSAQDALLHGDLDTAGREAIAAQGLLGDTAELKDLTKRITDREGMRKQRDRQLDEAQNLMNEGNAAKAEELLIGLAAANPNDSVVDGALRRAHKMHEDRDAVEKAVTIQLTEADQAVGRKDYESAQLAYTACKQLDPKNARATAGLEAVAAIKQQVAGIRDTFESALKKRDLATARTTLDQLRQMVPGSSTVVLAENEFNSSKLEEDAQAKAAAEKQLALESQAKELEGQMKDPARAVPALETALKEFLPKLAPEDPLRHDLDQQLEDRRQHDRLAVALASLDTAVVHKDETVIKQMVGDAEYASALIGLGSYAGLVFESHLDDFKRDGQKATARVKIHHALAVYPSRQLTYLYDLRGDDQGWTITSAHLQP